MTDRRYVRTLDTTNLIIGSWHEMLDASAMTLCARRLVPRPLGRDEGMEPCQFQHQRGTGFPPGPVCEECEIFRRWSDRELRGPIFDTAEGQAW